MTDKKVAVELTFPECVNRGEGPCDAWKGLVEQWRLAFEQGSVYKTDFMRLFEAADDIRRTYKDEGFPTAENVEALVECVESIMQEHAERQLICTRRS